MGEVAPLRDGPPAIVVDEALVDELYNEQVEAALLGGILVSPNAIDGVIKWLRPEHFSHEGHGRVFAAMTTCLEEGRKISPPVIKSMLGSGQWNEFLAGLVGAAATVINVPDFGRVVFENSIRRSLHEVGKDIALIAATPPPELRSIKAQLDDAEQRLGEVRELATVRSDRTMGAVLETSMSQIAEAYKGDVKIGIPLPLPELRYALDGDPDPGDLIGLLGASGDGKTSLLLQLARWFAEQGRPAHVLSGEQSALQCARQIQSQTVGVEVKAMREGRITPEEYELLEEDRRRLLELPLSIETWTDMRVNQLGSMIRRANRRAGGPGVVLIDHAKKIQPAYRNDNLAAQVFQIYDGLKDIATTTGNLIILLMQRNSDFLKRERMQPVRQDAYGGEGTIQNLDSCFGLFRESRWIRERAKLVANYEKRREMLANADALDISVGGEAGSGAYAALYPLKTRFGAERPERELRFEGAYTRFRTITDRDLAEDQFDLLR